MIERTPHSSGLAQFARTIGNLKSIPRTGWIDRGVPVERVESVADHSFRTAVLAWLAAAECPHLDRNRVLELALIHDLAEALTGDTTPYDRGELAELTAEERTARLNTRHRRSREDQEAKRERERVAIVSLGEMLEPAPAEELMRLWQEMADRETAEARFVKEVDVLETWLQSREFLDEDAELPMQSFELEAETELTEPTLRAIRDLYTAE